MEAAQICTTRKPLPFGQWEDTHEWHGSAKSPVVVHLDFLPQYSGNEAPKVLTCFPWPLRLVDDSNVAIWRSATYIRTDGANWFIWTYYRARAVVTQAYQWWKVRAILTAMVWGLADIKEGERPSWSHIGLKK